MVVYPSTPRYDELRKLQNALTKLTILRRVTASTRSADWRTASVVLDVTYRNAYVPQRSKTTIGTAWTLFTISGKTVQRETRSQRQGFAEASRRDIKTQQEASRFWPAGR